MKRLWLFSLLMLALVLPASAASTLEQVKQRGKLLCGVNQGLLGFSKQSDAGKWEGFDVDFCRALAAAVLNDPEKVEYVPLKSGERFEQLKAGTVDILSRNTTWTMERETSIGIRFVGISYHDGQGFMVKRLLGVTSALNLNGATVCFLSNTTSKGNMEDYFKEKEMLYTAVEYPELEDLLKAYNEDKCDTYTADLSQLYAARLKLAAPEDSVVLPEAISKEPLGPAIRQGDDQWLNIVRWTLFTLIDAEELGVTAANVEKMKAESQKPAIRKLLGLDNSLGQDMGLDADWSVRALKATGNYGEIFNRNLGKQTPLEIDRGLNALWNEGGLLFAPPVQ